MITENQIKRYINRSYGNCPRCQSGNIEGGSMDLDCNCVIQQIWCNSCGLNWEDNYTLDNIRIHNEDPWKEDPDYPRADWHHEIRENNTLRGYWDWVEHRREMNMDD